MTYERQFFKDGQVLKAEDLNKITGVLDDLVRHVNTIPTGAYIHNLEIVLSTFDANGNTNWNLPFGTALCKVISRQEEPIDSLPTLQPLSIMDVKGILTVYDNPDSMYFIDSIIVNSSSTLKVNYRTSIHATSHHTFTFDDWAKRIKDTVVEVV